MGEQKERLPGTLQTKQTEQENHLHGETEALKPLDHKRATGGKWLMLLVFIPCLITTLHMDNDIWFLLNSGRFVLQHGIPVIEPFTLHQGFSFVMQQWLSTVIFWGIYSKLGAAGILALVFLVFCATVAIVILLTKHLSGGNPIAAFLSALLTSAALKTVMVSRPMMFTMLILIVELYLLERFISERKPAYLLPLPVLSALLVNLHAAMWPIQFVILLPYLIDSFSFRFLFLTGQGYPKRYLFPAVALMAGAGFLNPYGLDAMTYVFRSYGFAEIGMVIEMQPADINTASGMLIFGLFFLILAIYMLKKKRDTRLRFALLSLGTAVLALSSIRSFALFAACGVFPLAYVLRDAELPQSRMQSQKSVLALRAVLIALVSLTVLAVVGMRAYQSIERGEAPEVSKAVTYLLEREDTSSMTLYTGYNDGGYAEYMGLKPYIDPRAEVFVEKNNGVKDVMKEYYDLQYGQVYYKNVLDTYGFTHLLVSREDILSVYLPHDDDYECIYVDETYQIFRRR